MTQLLADALQALMLIAAVLLVHVVAYRTLGPKRGPNDPA